MPVATIAHRGASYDAPEHTLAAYDLAISRGADAIETDVQLTADGVLVNIHDRTLERVTEGRCTALVGELTLEELRAFDVGSWFNRMNRARARPAFTDERPTTFAELLHRCRSATPPRRVFAELKYPRLAEGRAEEALVALLDREGVLKGDAGAVVVLAFDLATLERVRTLAPELPIGGLWVTPARGSRLLPWVDVSAPHVRALRLNRRHVARAHAAGCAVVTWTVNDPVVMADLVRLGVDGIVTDRPELLREVTERAVSGARGVGRPT